MGLVDSFKSSESFRGDDRSKASGLPTLPNLRSTDRDAPRLLILCVSAAVILYSFVVIWAVGATRDIGLRCVFGQRIKDVLPHHWSPAPLLDGAERAERSGYQWSPTPPRADVNGRGGDEILMIRFGDSSHVITSYTDYVKALRDLRNSGGKVGDARGLPVEVRWKSADGLKFGHVWAQRPPLSTYIWSLVWFAQEMLIFVVGARVVWKRPRDASARLFFWLCVVTVGAFMGGYHWSQIVVHRPLIFLFAGFAVFVPVLSLHFYLLFPRPNPVYVAYRGRVLTALYGVPTAWLLSMWSLMAWTSWQPQGAAVERVLLALKSLALGYVALAVLILLLCLACLIYSFRNAMTRAERNQVRWILLATLLALLPIAWLLWDASIDPAHLGMSRTAWPMFIVSLLYTVAYALSITRYRLMQAEELLNRGVVYFLVSLTAGLLYSGLLVVSALIINEKMLADRTSLGALVAGLTAIVILILSEALRQRFQKAIERRFFREKYKLDQAMRKMSLAVGSLVDRATLGHRLLEAASEVLRLEWGTIYLGDGPGGPLTLAASFGAEPDERTLAAENPLVERFRRQPTTLRVPHGVALVPAADPSTDAMIALGGEVATPLAARGGLAGILVLGPKRSGMPYEDEEVAFLGALGSVATMALHSAEIQHTLESLNHELRDKLDKIAEQQRRILILQDQLTGRGQRVEGLDANNGPLALPEPAAFGPIKGSGRAVRQMLEVARKVAASPSAVLI